MASMTSFSPCDFCIRFLSASEISCDGIMCPFNRVKTLEISSDPLLVESIKNLMDTSQLSLDQFAAHLDAYSDETLTDFLHLITKYEEQRRLEMINLKAQIYSLEKEISKSFLHRFVSFLHRCIDLVEHLCNYL